MSNNFKKTFYSSLLSVLLIITNLVCIKYTSFNDMVISVNFFVFPFIYLCFLIISDMYNKKEAYSSLISAVLIQIFILLSYTLITKCSVQSMIPDFSTYIDRVFAVDLVYIMINLIAIMISTFVLQYIYEYFSIIRKRFFGVVISVISAIILYGLITIPVVNYGFGKDIVLSMIICHLLISCLMCFVIVLLFYLLKCRDEEREFIFIKDINIKTPKEQVDKSITEVIRIVDKDQNHELKNSMKKTDDNKKKNTKKRSITRSNKNTTNSKNSKNNVKK